MQENNLDREYTQNGVYDRSILCAECDARLGRLDEYAYKVLPSDYDQTRCIIFRGAGEVYEFGAIDVLRFKMFLASLLWRMSLSTKPPWNLVSIGPYQQRLKNVLLHRDQETLNALTCVIVLFRPPKYPDILWSPFTMKQHGINETAVYLPPWKLHVKLDKRNFPEALEKLALKEGYPVFALVQREWPRGELETLRRFQVMLQNQKKTSEI